MGELYSVISRLPLWNNMGLRLLAAEEFLAQKEMGVRTCSLIRTRVFFGEKRYGKRGAFEQA